MSNTHEYVVFDRAKLNLALAMKWPAFEKAFPGWEQWESAQDFLENWGLGEAHAADVDEIFARKTVRATLLLSDDAFHFLLAILDEKGLSERSIGVGKGDYDYGHDVVACAGAAFLRRDVSLATLTAVYHLHASLVDPLEVLPPDVVSALREQPKPPPMLPGFPDMMPGGADGIGTSQARRVIDFLRLAWRERWPLRAGETIRSCEVAGNLVKALRNRRLAKPCIFRWYEC